MKKIAMLLAGMFLAASSARAEGGLSSGGPRVGLIYQTNKSVRSQLSEYVKSRNKEAKPHPMLSAFGWQFEYEYLNTEGGTTGLMEFVPLVLGLDMGLAIPSINTVIGVRFADGLEIGCGPNFSTGVKETVHDAGTPDEHIDRKTVAGVGMVGVIGKTLKAGQMNFPVNLAAVWSDTGTTVSILLGWTR